MGVAVSDELKSVAATVFTEVKIKKSETLIRIGELDNHVYFVVSGILRDYYIASDGSDATQFFSREGSLIGCTLISNEPSAMCTEALENCVLLCCKNADFRKLIDNNSEFSAIWIKTLEYSLAYKIKRENSFLVKTAAERYIDFRRENPALEKRVSQKYIASYLGVTPVSLSRIRRALKELE